MKTQNEPKNIRGLLAFWIFIVSVFLILCGLQLGIKIKWPWEKETTVVELVQEKIYTPEEFISHVIGIADSFDLSGSEKIIVSLLYPYESIKGTTARKAIIEPFKSEWEYTAFCPVLERFPLSVRDEYGLQIPCYECRDYYFPGNYGPGEKFYVNPKPKYIIHFDNKVYLIGYNRKPWRQRY